ncbi:MAG: UGSC family (seleno)protein [Acidimicrobiales bacterium]
MCAPAVVGLAAQLESEGIPTVGIQATTFKRIAASASRARGISELPQIFVPDKLDGRTAQDYRGFIRGSDPVLGRPFLEELIEGITVEVKEGSGGPAFIPNERFVDVSDAESAFNLFEARGWTDHLPIVLPTPERVEAMLSGTSHSPDQIVARVAPAWSRVPWEFNVEQVGVNAVMAGARPEYLPVILALMSTGESARMSSLTSMATIGIVNGPIRTQIGMNPGIGAMGPFNHANTTIGRAFALCSQNLGGGSEPGDTYMGTLGNPYNYSAVYPENEEASPWEPLHVSGGASPDQSMVNLFIGGWGTISFWGPRRSGWEEIDQIAIQAVDPGMPPLAVLDPVVANDFQEAGFDKARLVDWVATSSLMPAGRHWRQLPSGPDGKTRAPDELVQMYLPEQINVVVLGGGTKGHAKLISARHLASASVDDWR